MTIFRPAAERATALALCARIIRRYTPRLRIVLTAPEKLPAEELHSLAASADFDIWATSREIPDSAKSVWMLLSNLQQLPEKLRAAQKSGAERVFIMANCHAYGEPEIPGIDIAQFLNYEYNSNP